MFELVLLLNASLQPLNVISKRRLVVLLTKQRVTFMDEVARQAVEQAMARRCFGQDVVIVRLLSNIQIPRRLLRANRRNLLLRDDGTCQYCGKGMPSAQLSVDHVVPTSRGGAANSWENQVIACRRCNGRKGNRLLSEAGMRLIRPPHALTQEFAHLIFLRPRFFTPERGPNISPLFHAGAGPQYLPAFSRRSGAPISPRFFTPERGPNISPLFHAGAGPL
ncbi:MAG: HNH endonuclease [Chloroflexi bacterium]|nr:MAG: HNH endonuclease [Chloroflexota bacterium]